MSVATAVPDEEVAANADALGRRFSALSIFLVISFLPSLTFALTLFVPPNVATMMGALAVAAAYIGVAAMNGARAEIGLRLPTPLVVLLGLEVVSLAIFIESADTVNTTLLLIGLQVVVAMLAYPIRRRLAAGDTESVLTALFWSSVMFFVFALPLTLLYVGILPGVASPFDGRFRLLALAVYGHSLAGNAAALMAIAWLLRERPGVLRSLLVLAIASAVLVGSQARMSLAYEAIIVLVLLYRVRLIGTSMLATLGMAMLVFLYLVTYTEFGRSLTDILIQLQELLPDVRILSGGTEITTGRLELNNVLLDEFWTSPIVGVGYSNLVLQRGAAYALRLGYEVKAGVGESGLRLLVARGLIVWMATMIFYAAGLFRPQALLIAGFIMIGSTYLLNGGLERMASVLDIWMFFLAILAYPTVQARANALPAGLGAPAARPPLLRRPDGLAPAVTPVPRN